MDRFELGCVKDFHAFLDQTDTEFCVFGDTEIGIEGTGGQNEVAKDGNITSDEERMVAVESGLEADLREKERFRR